VNAPLLEQKGQTQISGHKSFNGLEGQAATAFTNHIALLANYCNIGSKIKDEKNYVDKHIFKEIGVGLYKKTVTGKYREVFLMLGKGMTAHTALKGDTTGIIRSQNVKYSRFTIQTDLGTKINKLEYAWSPRLVAVHYYHIVDNTRSDYKGLSDFHIYAEGALTLRYTLLNYLKISGQLSATLPLIRSGVDTIIIMISLPLISVLV